MSTEPTTTLDTRFSQPDAQAISWADTVALLEQAELSWLSTVRADGRPHVTPLVAVWLAGTLYFHTGAQEQKYVNLRANRHVVLTTGCNRWDGGVDVVVEGEAVPVTDDAVLRRVAAAYATKWDGRWQLEARDGHLYDSSAPDASFASEVFGVTPTRAFSHAKGQFGATTHRFR